MSKKTKIQKQRPLSGKQCRYLRGLGHHLSPLVMLGKEGVTDALITSAQEVLTAHELVKVKLMNTCSLDPIEASQEMSARTGAAVAQILGKTFLLFKENKMRPTDKKIEFP
jgi:RNA-binding protein